MDISRNLNNSYLSGKNKLPIVEKIFSPNVVLDEIKRISLDFGQAVDTNDVVKIQSSFLVHSVVAISRVAVFYD